MPAEADYWLSCLNSVGGFEKDEEMHHLRRLGVIYMDPNDCTDIKLDDDRISGASLVLIVPDGSPLWLPELDLHPDYKVAEQQYESRGAEVCLN